MMSFQLTMQLQNYICWRQSESLCQQKLLVEVRLIGKFCLGVWSPELVASLRRGAVMSRGSFLASEACSVRSQQHLQTTRLPAHLPLLAGFVWKALEPGFPLPLFSNVLECFYMCNNDLLYFYSLNEQREYDNECVIY